MSLKLVKFAKDWDWEVIDKQYDKVMNVKIEIGEFMLAEPSFRTKSRLVVIKNTEQKVRFALEYQSEDEPGVWIRDPSFPWQDANFDSIIRAAARYHDRIEKVLKGEKGEK